MYIWPYFYKFQNTESNRLWVPDIWNSMPTVNWTEKATFFEGGGAVERDIFICWELYYKINVLGLSKNARNQCSMYKRTTLNMFVSVCKIATKVLHHSVKHCKYNFVHCFIHLNLYGKIQIMELIVDTFNILCYIPFSDSWQLLYQIRIEFIHKVHGKLKLIWHNKIWYILQITSIMLRHCSGSKNNFISSAHLFVVWEDNALKFGTIIDNMMNLIDIWK